MKKARKALLTLCAALLLVTMTAGITVAYLTSTDSVNNTFTVGNVTITLDEEKVDLYGKDENTEIENRVKANKYKLVPGHEYTKDPTIHVADDSEDCWLFAKIENGLGDEAVLNIDSNNWTLVDGTEGLYVYKDSVSADTDVVIFTTFTTTTDAAFENLVLDGEENATAIKVTAYAIQKDGLEKTDAIDEAKEWAYPTTGA